MCMTTMLIPTQPSCLSDEGTRHWDLLEVSQQPTVDVVALLVDGFSYHMEKMGGWSHGGQGRTRLRGGLTL